MERMASRSCQRARRRRPEVSSALGHRARMSPGRSCRASRSSPSCCTASASEYHGSVEPLFHGVPGPARACACARGSGNPHILEHWLSRAEPLGLFRAGRRELTTAEIVVALLFCRRSIRCRAIPLPVAPEPLGRIASPAQRSSHHPEQPLPTSGASRRRIARSMQRDLSSPEVRLRVSGVPINMRRRR
jgi:hypothetical protein